MKLAIIIPTYNEAENIRQLIDQILYLYPKSIVVVVDDNSPDGTSKIASKISKKVFLIRRRAKLGLGSAERDGINFSLKNNADLVLTMDGDLSHNPKYISKMLENIGKYDVVIGSRYITGGSIVGFTFYRKLISRLAQFFSNNILRVKLRDSTSNFRLYKRKVLENLDINSIKSDGYSFLIETIYRAHRLKYNLKEIPIVFKVRVNGKSKISDIEIFKAIITVIKLFSFDILLKINGRHS